MGVLGVIALIAAMLVAGSALLGAARPETAGAGSQARRVSMLKLAAWLGLAAVLFTAKLFPVALMVLIAAGGVTGIEIWRDRMLRAETAEEAAADARLAAGSATRVGSDEEAASILGVSVDASADDVRSAHRRLISKLHPDQGGTDFLASQINSARDRLDARAARRPPAATMDEAAPPVPDAARDDPGAV